MGVNTERILVYEQDLVRIEEELEWDQTIGCYSGTLATVIGLSKGMTATYDLLMSDGTLQKIYPDEFVVVQSRSGSRAL
ncbi:hypothetical protein HN588_03800 [Candidatus Bathyarchaeota archaeon]|jgi:hypothetical protein|nr:hypothetical protein [Candidatus Bathyarchaeota archaeon]